MAIDKPSADRRRTMRRTSNLKAVSCVMALSLVLVVSVILAAGCGGQSTVGQFVNPVQSIKQNANNQVRAMNLQVINMSIQTYYTENGKYPTNMSQLSKYFMKGIPADPAGGSYYIVMKNGVAKAAVR